MQGANKNPGCSRYSKLRLRTPGRSFGRLLPLAFVFIVFTVTELCAAEIYERVARETGRFLTAVIDARSEALGRAGGAAASGFSGIFLNPAGLAFSEGIQTAVQGYLTPASEWETPTAEGGDLAFAGFSLPMGLLWRPLENGNLAIWRISADFRGVGWLTETTPASLGDLDQWALGFSYAHLFSGCVAVGLTYKRVESNWQDDSKWGWIEMRAGLADYGGNGLDVGVLYRDTFKLAEHISLELSGALGERNLGTVRYRPPPEPEEKDPSGNPYLVLSGVDFRLPQRHFLAVAPALGLWNRQVAVTPAAELTYCDETLQWRWAGGLEVELLGAVAARIGSYEAEIISGHVETIGIGAAFRFGESAGLTYDWALSYMPGHSPDMSRHLLRVTFFKGARGFDLDRLNHSP